jgi:NAD(P)-dependent dehydrogenase (short-subunit alcohol dehydrogenase family)
MTAYTYSRSAVALVTGARGGIGREIVARLREGGCRVAAVGRSLPALGGIDADARIEADTSTPDGALQAVRVAREHLGGTPTLLAHCVGNTLIQPLHRTRAEQFREVMATNVDSAFYVLQAFVEGLRAQNGGAANASLAGAAVFVSSVVSRIGVANHEAIAAAKGAIEALARSAAATYAAQGLRINVVAPGLTETPMTAGMLKLDAMREGAGKQYPLGGVQSAGQVADVMAFLLSEQSCRLTGQIIPVDGGFAAIRPLVR